MGIDRKESTFRIIIIIFIIYNYYYENVFFITVHLYQLFNCSCKQFKRPPLGHETTVLE